MGRLFAKAVRQGILDRTYLGAARRGYQGILGNLIRIDESGLVDLEKTCSVGGLGGAPYRDGSYEYYIGEAIATGEKMRARYLELIEAQLLFGMAPGQVEFGHPIALVEDLGLAHHKAIDAGVFAAGDVPQIPGDGIYAWMWALAHQIG